MANDNWQTPLDLFYWIQDEMGVEFILDPCTTETNPLGTLYYFTPEHDGLNHSWYMEEPTDAFMNYPYSRGEIDKWVKKASIEAKKDDMMVTGLLPLRTAKWFMENINNIGVHLPDLSKWRTLNNGE